MVLRCFIKLLGSTARKLDETSGGSSRTGWHLSTAGGAGAGDSQEQIHADFFMPAKFVRQHHCGDVSVQIQPDVGEVTGIATCRYQQQLLDFFANQDTEFLAGFGVGLL